MKAFALSTVDNPFNPFENFRDWWNYDTEHNYDCCAILSRLVVDSNDMLDSEKQILIEAAINRFIEADPIGLYIKVVDEVSDQNYKIS